MAQKQLGRAPATSTDAARLGDLRASFRNRLRNGNLAVNQRGVSGTVTLAAGAYGHDGWAAGASGCTYTFSAAANGNTTATITAGTLLQVVEGALYLSDGSAYVLSWSGTAQGRVYQGAASGAYGASPIAATGLTAGTNATVEFGTGTLTLAQLEPGAVATTFERRDDELSRCHRYLYVVGGLNPYGYFETGAFVSAVQFYFVSRFRRRMRATPALTTSGSFNVLSGGAAAATTGFSLNQATADEAGIVASTSGAQGAAGILQAANSAAARLIFSAEL